MTAAFGSAVASAQAADFSLPIQQAANATGVTSVRNSGLDGSGITIGIISNSFNTTPTMNSMGTPDTLNYDIKNGYLPSQIQIVKDFNGSLTDEGRAIGQVIHAVAPGAKLAFYTGSESQSDFANGIQALESAGANIIVDDIQYVSEPNPPAGAINQAINTVVNQGVNYLTSAGNNAGSFQLTPLTIYGHASNPNAVTVGAVYEGNPTTSNYNYAGFSPTPTVQKGQLEPFSKPGANSPSCSTSPDITCKPDVVGPDGLPISFNLNNASPSEVTSQGTFYDFFGTSAAAPYTAAVAALLLQADPQATNSQIYAALTQTATPLNSSGFSNSSGYGLIQADKALAYLQATSVPEPSSFAGLIAFGFCYAGFLFLKRPISVGLQAKQFAVKPVSYKD
ncbi:MAG: S8 family serine peptidase [Chroococcidiopsidaceae cyanobacterium CP_BM_ER_R8_30]|nr:S8 family serine peptidase [Chroococcidiopsidaceae cyanobacterium CP_BM_ER_R8_30]